MHSTHNHTRTSDNMIIAQLDEKVHSGVVKPAVKSAPTDPLSALADLYDPSVAIKVIEVAKKYNQPEVSQSALGPPLMDLRASRCSGRQSTPFPEVQTLTTAPKVSRLSSERLTCR